MKAIEWTRYGPPDVLQLAEVEKPSPRDTEILIKIHASTVTAGDCEIRGMKLPFYFSFPMRLFLGLRRPSRVTILGTELAGEVVAVGPAVTRFKVGDSIIGSTGFTFGAYAEYICVPEVLDEGAFALKPANMSYEEAVTLPFGANEALHFLRMADIQPGQTVLINGAGGSIGTFGIQLAKHYGAEVTAIDSTAKLDLLRALGADHVIDYTQEKFAQRGPTYDVIFDVIGKGPFAHFLQALKPQGTYLMANPRPSKMLHGRWVSMRSSKTVSFAFANRNVDDLIHLTELAEAGILTPAIDRRYPLEQIVEAHRYAETGQKKGHVVITIMS